MNYFAHGRDSIDDPYYLAGTAVPDWLNVTDRGVRVRSKHALLWVDDADPRMAAVARGIARHHADDGWFHETPAFAELSLQLTAEVRDVLEGDPGFRPSFLGHILVEILLDDVLAAAEPERLEAYYQAMAALDHEFVATAVNRMAPRPAVGLAWLIPRFVAERFLWDYSDDGKLTYRLNQVMRRVGLPALPTRFERVLPSARRLVAERRQDLLTPTMGEPTASGPTSPAEMRP